MELSARQFSDVRNVAISFSFESLNEVHVFFNEKLNFSEIRQQ